jgi:limonene 1,2-monooxygenase
VTVTKDWYDLQNGYLQIRPVQDDLEIVAAVSISPSGMRLAGKYGLGVISVASYSEEGLNALPTQWSWAETYAQEFGKTVSRDNWRVMMPFHIAEDRQTAFEEIYDGLGHWHNAYNVDTLARPGAERVDDVKGFAHKMVDRGGAIVGTPDDAVEAIGRLYDLAGGFGTLVGFMHDWTNQQAMLRSYDMFARYVIPRVQGLLRPVERSQSMLKANNSELMARSGEGILKAIRAHNAAHPRPR